MIKESSEELRKEYSNKLSKSNNSDVDKKIFNTLIKESTTTFKLFGILTMLKGFPEISTKAEEWDNKPWLLNVQNGIINLETLELEPHEPKQLFTTITNTDYKPGSKSKLWEKHLEIFLPDKDIQREVKRNLGISLVGEHIDEILPIWYGPSGKNGKSTTALIIKSILGDYVDDAAPGLLLEKKWDRHPTEIAELEGKRLIFSAEVGEGKKLDEELVKRITGGEILKGRYMRQDFFEVKPSFTFFLYCNDYPVIEGTDEAIWRRPRLIPWENQIADSEKKPQAQVIKELIEEGSAILQWMLDGLKDWNDDHLWIAPQVKTATNKYRNEQDKISNFLKEKCIKSSHRKIVKGYLYYNYKGFCFDNDIEPLEQNPFNRALIKKGLNGKSKKLQQRAWEGLSLKPEIEKENIDEGKGEKQFVDKKNSTPYGEDYKEPY